MKALRPTASTLVAAMAALGLACGGGAPEEGGGADTTAQEEVMAVPDSVIVTDVQSRIDSDPRLRKEGVSIEVHAKDGEVTLVGTVPTRFEQSIAREAALGAPGVRKVYLDSLVVAAETREEEPGPSA